MPSFTLRYGDGKTLRLDVEAEVTGYADEPTAATQSGGGDAVAVERALANPIDYPPLRSCLAPGDCVTLAVAAGVPSPAAVVGGAIDALVAAGVEPERITVLVESREDTKRLEKELAHRSAAGVRFVTHDPADHEGHAVAGMLSNDQPLVLDRSLVLADVAIPISCVDVEAGGPLAGLYPAFSDTAARQQHAGESAWPGGGSGFATPHEEAGWLLGVTMTLQVMPSVVGGVEAAFAGPPAAVASASAKLASQLWSRPSGRREASLVIATITGGEDQQNWASVAKALDAAESVASADGAVALCTDLGEEFGAELARRLADAAGADLDHGEYGWDEPAGENPYDVDEFESPEDSGSAEERKQAAAEVAACERLLRARARGPVYLMSRLDPDWVEEVGLAPVASEKELARLATRRGSCVVIEGAQHAAAIGASAGRPASPVAEEDE